MVAPAGTLEFCSSLSFSGHSITILCGSLRARNSPSPFFTDHEPTVTARFRSHTDNITITRKLVPKISTKYQLSSDHIVRRLSTSSRKHVSRFTSKASRIVISLGSHPITSRQHAERSPTHPKAIREAHRFLSTYLASSSSTNFLMEGVVMERSSLANGKIFVSPKIDTGSW